VVAFVVLLALALRAYHLGYKSLWLDELNLLRSSYGNGALFARFGYSILDHPPGYLVILRLLMHIGRQEWLLRLPALLASVGSVIALWAMARTMLGSLVGILASLVLALLPMHIAYAQEAHSYGLYGLLSVLLLWSLYRAALMEMASEQDTRGEQRWRNAKAWAPFVLITILALYVHYYSFYLVALSVLLFPLFALDCCGGSLASLWRDRFRRRALLRLAMSLLVTTALYLPQAIFGVGNSLRYANNLAKGLAYRSLADSISWAFRGGLNSLQDFPWATWGAIVVLVLGLAWQLWRRRHLAVSFLLILVLPLVPSLWLAYQTGIAFNSRRVIFVLPVLAVVAGTGLTAVAGFAGQLWTNLQSDQDHDGEPGGVGRSQATVATAAFLAIVTIAAAVGPVQAYYTTPKQDWKTLGRLLTTLVLPADAAVAQEKAARNLSWYYPEVQVIGSDPVPVLEELCQSHAKVYLTVMPNEPFRGTDADWLAEAFVEIPLKDLKLFYRNCSAQADWYGEGGVPLFEMAFDPHMPFLPIQQAYSQYQHLASTYAPADSESTGDRPAGRQEAAANESAPAAAVEDGPSPVKPSAESPEPPPTWEGPPTRQVAEEFLRAGYAEEALEMFQELLLTQSEDRGTHMGLAAALAATGEIDEALETYASIEANWPDFPWVFIRRGELWEGIGNIAAALAEYQAALRVVPDDPDAYFVLGFAFDRLNMPQDAIVAFQAGLQLDPSREGPRQALKGLLERE
jgi:tetratricopeptide (TPR) repeat protein